ncbi:heat shock protein 70 family protein [Kipferlia bialata]|uniref:Heat shock protein 70 family protein n=1 Tax=Kipferlia bialata TaxID=797122 RepID=A0A9K3CX24_9EUKA|nr:heat shock protein 70 family protein [Kipferlia bialata]GIQ84052.1 heat shock protein 70 family protein [Kipferlia bialata]|eukprot:g3372.t1
MPVATAQPDVKLTVGIDFGTSHSGYAVSHVAKPEEVEAFYDWPGQPAPYAKTLTALFYEQQPDGTYKATSWGFQAWLRQREISCSTTSLYVSRFKLLLDECVAGGEVGLMSKERPLDIIRIPPGLTLESVIGDYLRYLKQSVETVIRKQYDGILTLDNVQWCLSVPAMWTDRAKARMRQAAYIAGMIPDIDSHRLTFTLEPEAAAVYCSHNRSQYHFGKGQSFMVVDAGGGTVDLTVHKVTGSGAMEEVTRGHGRSCGATYLDVEFLKFVRGKLGEEYYSEWCSKYPSEMAVLMSSWEKCKRNFSGPEDESMFIAMPPKMYKRLPVGVEDRLTDEQDGYDDCLVVTGPEAVAVFDPVVAKVLGCIEEQMKRLKEEGGDTNRQLKAMLLVGGFSASPYLIKRVREVFGDRSECIINPPQPGAAVVVGAVHYGSNPSVIKARISRFTYGFKGGAVYNPQRPGHKRRESQASWDERAQALRFKGVFNPIIRMGDRVPCDHTVVQTGRKPIYADQTRVSFQLYCCAGSPFFVTEDGVQQLGERVTVTVPTEEERHVDLRFLFGDTEFRMVVTPRDKSCPALETTAKFQSK